MNIVDVPGDQDDDGDGLTRAQEDNLGTSDNNPDSDGDGFEDGEEFYCMGTDPTDPNSGPFHLKIYNAPDNITLSWSTQPGISYYIESSPDMSPNSWHKVAGTDVTSPGIEIAIPLPNNPNLEKTIFYRVHVSTCENH